MRGFSLIESIVAAGLLAITLILLAHVVSVAVSTNTYARQATLSAVFACEKLEQLRLAPSFDSLPDVTEYLDDQGLVVCGGRPCELAVYIRRWSITPFGDVPDAFLVQVGVHHRASVSREAREITVRAPGPRE